MRFVKRRNPASRPAVKSEGIIIFHNATRNWRERLKALKAAQDAEQGKDEGVLSKPTRT